VLPLVLLTISTLQVLPDKGSEEVARHGKVFTLIRGSNETRVLKDLGDGVRVEVVSSTVDSEILLRIADDISRDKAVGRIGSLSRFGHRDTLEHRKVS